MSKTILENSLEGKYIKEAYEGFAEDDEKLYKDIVIAFEFVSQSVTNILGKSYLDSDQKDASIDCVVDLVESYLLNNPRFGHSLDKFITEKTDIINSNKTVDSLIVNILEATEYFEQILIEIKILNEKMIGITNTLSSGVNDDIKAGLLLNAQELFEKVDAWIKANDTNKYVEKKAILSALQKIEDIRSESPLTIEQEEQIYDFEGVSLGEKVILDVELENIKLLGNFNCLSEDIDEVKSIKLKLESKKKQTYEFSVNAKVDSLKNEIEAEFGKDDLNRVRGSINFIVGRVVSTIESDNIEHSEKLKLLADPFSSFGFYKDRLNNNSTALNLLSILLEVYVKEYISLYEDKESLHDLVPKKLLNQVVFSLYEIRSKYLNEHKGDLETNRLIITKKCNDFLHKFNKKLKLLYSMISQKLDYDEFKLREIKPILISIEIPERYYDFFYDIGYIYYRDGVNTFVLNEECEKNPVTIVKHAYIEISDHIGTLSIDDKKICNKLMGRVMREMGQKVLPYVDILVGDMITKDLNEEEIKKHKEEAKIDETKGIIMMQFERRKSIQAGVNKGIKPKPITQEQKIAINTPTQPLKPVFDILDQANNNAEELEIKKITKEFLRYFPEIKDKTTLEHLEIFIRRIFFYELRRIMKNQNYHFNFFDKQ